MNLDGRVALVTGSARRIGRAIVEALAARGARVAVHYGRSAAEANEVVEGIQARGGTAHAFAADLASMPQLHALVRKVTSALGGVDVLVNSASVFYRTPLDTLDVKVWEDNIAVNLTAPYVLGLELGRAMRARGAGKIVNIGDSDAARPYREYIPYSVSKAALETLTRGLAKALAPEVQVNCVAPGPILMPAAGTEAERARILARTPLGRFGDPSDIVAAVLFLIEQGDFVTGATIPVDGGRAIN
jgi:NAD(P)-dependent dehydrogenase (short-subunit alcohol dehydrogenase family)